MTFQTLQEAISHLEKMGITTQSDMLKLGIRLKEVK